MKVRIFLTALLSITLLGIRCPPTIQLQLFVYVDTMTHSSKMRGRTERSRTTTEAHMEGDQVIQWTSVWGGARVRQGDTRETTRHLQRR